MGLAIHAPVYRTWFTFAPSIPDKVYSGRASPDSVQPHICSCLNCTCLGQSCALQTRHRILTMTHHKIRAISRFFADQTFFAGLLFILFTINDQQTMNTQRNRFFIQHRKLLLLIDCFATADKQRRKRHVDSRTNFHEPLRSQSQKYCPRSLFNVSVGRDEEQRHAWESDAHGPCHTPHPWPPS